MSHNPFDGVPAYPAGSLSPSAPPAEEVPPYAPGSYTNSSADYDATAPSAPARALSSQPSNGPTTGTTASLHPGVTFREPNRLTSQTALVDNMSKDSFGLSPIPSLTALDQVPVLTSSSTAAPNHHDPTLPPDPVDQFRYDPEQGFSAARPNPEFKRKRSLVRPDRERMDPSHRQWYYRNHAAQMQAGQAGTMPSNTGHLPQHGGLPQGVQLTNGSGPGGGLSGLGLRPGLPGAPNAYNLPPGGLGRGPGGATGVRRGKSLLGRDDDQLETAINVLKRGVSIRRHQPDAAINKDKMEVPRDLGEFKPSSLAPGPVDVWMTYCYCLTVCVPPALMRCFGIRTPEQQRAWREKIGLISVVTVCMAFVGFLTFGFTQTVCGNPANRYVANTIDAGSSISHGSDIDFNDFYHPQVGPFGADTVFNHTNPAYSQPWLTGARDISLLFQKVDGKCTNMITAKQGSTAPKSSTGGPANYFPCYVLNQNSSQVWYQGTSATSMCHSQEVRTDYFTKTKPTKHSKTKKSKNGYHFQGDVYYTWGNISRPDRNLVVWKNSVLDLDRLQLLDRPNLNYPPFFDQIMHRNSSWAGQDVSSTAFKLGVGKELDCLQQIVGVGAIDSSTIGCVASQVELYLSLVFIVGVVLVRFFMAVMFGWCLSWRLGTYGKKETPEQRKKRRDEIEAWSSDIYKPAPARYRPNAKKAGQNGAKRSFFPSSFPSSSRFSHANATKASLQTRLTQEKFSGKFSAPTSPAISRAMGPWGSSNSSFVDARAALSQSQSSQCPFPLTNVVPQPSPDFMPFGFPLAHSICLVTAYSESFEGLRTTLDSLATTDYPNSHKFLLVIADGIVKGDGSDLSTPDICLSMMKDLIVPAEDVEGHSYVAIADGFKRHNMAKVYAGFYDYDNSTVERSKQQRVPMILVAKCGSPLEADSAKPGNRGKRDSQVMLMAFLQKLMFDERMTLFEYEFFNAIWRTTGVPPDRYEIILMVDADTKVFPDALSRMVSCMVEDPEIMGLCGETKIANKSDSWVTMIQVFEYYVSHHSQKACEACFGGVTCLPGCFSAYRIKAPKGPNGYWVPILANPDIVEHYSENVVDTLHKKNLLLLGEDRYLTTLMLKTFPKRKMMFVPQAVCKTIVPDTFKVLLSQRRRWINSTVHNLFELVLVNELCGVFCLSMRFMIAMELVGTLVLPAALAFTFYVVGIAIKNGITGGPIPIIPLVLLGVILGLPGVLIVVTSRKWSYVGWMGIYLLSLPIWNLALPTYAFWHFDDFSWGATRVVQGEGKGGGDHSGSEGTFDQSNIVMKRWADFERERRLRAGTESRDSTYDVVHRAYSADSDHHGESTRHSTVSSDTYHSGSAGDSSRPTANLLASASEGHSHSIHSDLPGSRSTRARLDHVPLLELPAPLAPDAANRPAGASAPAAAGSISVPRPTNYNVRDPSPSIRGSSSVASPSVTPSLSYPVSPTSMHDVYPTTSTSYASGMPTEPSPAMIQARQQALGLGSPGTTVPAPAAARGVSLVDEGPVASLEGMRPVQRPSRP